MGNADPRDASNLSSQALPLVPAQRGMWFAEGLSSDYSVNIAQYLDLRYAPDDFDHNLFAECNKAAGRAMESPYVRLTDLPDGSPGQVVDLTINHVVEVMDFRSESDPVQAAQMWMRAEYRRPLDLRNDKLVVSALLRVADDRTFWYGRGHHIVIDGYAALTMVRMTVERYNAARRGIDLVEKPLATMADIVADEEKYATSTRRETDGAHWHDRMADLPERVSLARHDLAPVLDADNVVVSETLSDEFQRRIETRAAELGSSTAVLLTAAFGAFLYRMTDIDDVVVSLPVTGRSTAKIKRAGGMLSNILPVRLRGQAEQTVRSLIAATQVEMTGALRHQRYRSEDIKRAAGLDSDTVGFGPTINMMFFDAPIGIDNVSADYRILTSGILEDLLVNLYQASPGAPLVVDMHGNPHRYSRGELEVHHRRFLTFVERFIADVDVNVAELDLLLPGETSELDDVQAGPARVWTESEVGTGTHLLDLYLRQVSENPDRVAVVDGDSTYNYAQFDAVRSKLARMLRADGVTPGLRVAVGLDRGVEQLATIYATLTVGAAYVPLDPSLPASRRSLILDVAQPAVVVDPDYLAQRGFSAADVGAEPVEPLSAASGAAYVIFTSGSTGTPKGVEVSHPAIVNRLAWMAHDYPLGVDDVVLYKTPFTFDVSLGELFGPMQVGARLVIAAPGGHRDPAYLRDLIVSQSITSVHFVPSMLDVFVEAVESDQPALPATVSRVVTSGEALPASLAREVVRRSDVDLVNLYGPTEAAVEVTEYLVRGTESSIPIGRPVANTTTLVLDSRLRRVPVGVIGELYLGGVQLANGYVAQTGLTSERFVANPFGDGDRLYRTGDRVRWTADGTLEYLGRTDFQVKIRGQRVELGEIEATLLSDPDVDSAVVVVRTESGGALLVAYAKSASDPTQVADRLLAHCRDVLPGHMVPAAVVVLPEFPINSSGKLDRAALPEPSITVAADVEYVEASSTVEKQLATVISDLLGADRISMRDNLFTLGADSLMAARMATRLRRDHGLVAPLTAIFGSRDVGELAAALDDEGEQTARPVLQPQHRPDILPTSTAQTRLWFINRMDPSAGTYNMPGAVRLGPDVDVDAMRAAVLDVVGRHESLRTTFPSVDGEPTQLIHSVDDVAAHLDVVVRDVADHELAATIASVASAGFDLSSQLPIRATVLHANASTSAESSGENVLVVVVHHISADGGSMGPLVADLLTAYNARRHGFVPFWTSMPVQYADYALWQRELLGDPDDANSLQHKEVEFWSAELAGIPEMLSLPTDRPRLAVPTGAGAYVDHVLNAQTVAGIRRIAASEGVTTFSVLQAAFALVLSRLGDTDDVIIGTAVAGRDEPELAGLIGMFVNTLSLRTSVRPADTVGELLRRAHAGRARALAHAQVPFEQIVEAVAPSRTLSHSPIFQVAMTLQHDQLSAVADADMGFELVESRVPAAKYDLSLSGVEYGQSSAHPNEISLELSYATDLFDHATAARVVEYLERALIAMSADSDRAVGSIDLLPASQVSSLTAQPAHRVEPTTLQRLVTDWLVAPTETPFRAMISGGAKLSARATSDRVNQIARELASRGASPGEVVVISLGRSVNSVVAALAVASTGAAFVSVDPRHPADRRAALVEDSGARIGISAAGVELPVAADIDWLLLDDPSVELQLAGHPTAPPDLPTPRVDDLAYLIYTSGSTGRPKAVEVSHRGLANLVANQRSILDLTGNSTVLHVASPSFDASIFEIAMAIGAGGSLVVADSDTYAGEPLEQLIAAEGVTHVVMTPSALATLDPAAVPTLTTVLSAGEACPPELVDRWVRAGRSFHNLYGPTEATIWATADGPLRADDVVTVGHGVPGVGAYVLDPGLRPVPDGVPGELYLSGEQLARGYRGRSGLTATTFIANPFAAGERLYRTGDRVTRRADGRLIYHGRNDFQLKIRGLRIEPGEVDAVLTTHPTVANALSLGVPGPAGDAVLVAYVSPRDGATIDPDTLLAYVRERLPSYMVPHTLMEVAEFPRTDIGKIDRRQLPEVEFSVSTEFIPPRTELEAVVADIVAGVLGIDRISVTDGFFEVGGNSLSAAKVAARLSSVLDRQVGVQAVFEAPTVAALTEFVASGAAGHPSIPLVAKQRSEVVPVSAVQRGMWLLNRADPESAAYNVSLALSLKGDLNVDALRSAIGDVVARHESMRTHYPMINGVPTQVISPAESVTDLVSMPVTEVSGDLGEAITAITGLGFDVTTRPPLRLALLKVSDTEHVVVLVIHHISADGASMAPLARDLMTAYAARADGAAPHWAPLRIQYADFTQWQGERLAQADEQGTEEKRQLNYWTQRLAGAPEVIDLPTDRPRAKTPSFVGGQISFDIPADLGRSLEALARVHNTTLFMVTHAAFAVLLSRLTGRSDIVIGTPFAGRGDQALDDVVGMFVNSLALRTELDPGQSFGDLLARVRTNDLTDMAHADVAFDTIAQRIVASPTAAYNPVFQVIFAFQNLEFPTLRLGDITIAPIVEDTVAAKVDLQLSIFPDDPALMGEHDANTPIKGQFVYATDLFDHATIEKVAQRYLRVLTTVAEDPTVHVGDISLHLADDMVVADGVETGPSTLPFADLIAAATNEQPDTAAVEWEGATLSFGQLSALVTAMAAALPNADTDAALTMAIMSSLPGLAAAGPQALGDVLDVLRHNALTVVRQDESVTTVGNRDQGNGDDGNREQGSHGK